MPIPGATASLCRRQRAVNMIALLQRVTEAGVRVGDEELASIGAGLLVLVGVQRRDTEANARRLMNRVLGYRVFPDDAGRMNRSLLDAGGDILLVPQFTLVADTAKGTRPGFSAAADPALGRAMFSACLAVVAEHGLRPAAGRFGADMRVWLVNDGPVTFWLQVPPSGPLVPDSGR